MAMYNFYFLPDYNVSKHWEEREDGWEAGLAVDDEEWDMVDFEPVCEISYSCPTLVCMRNDYYFVSAIDELASKLVNVALYSSGLGEEPVADQGDVVGHCEEEIMPTRGQL